MSRYDDIINLPHHVSPLDRGCPYTTGQHSLLRFQLWSAMMMPLLKLPDWQKAAQNWTNRSNGQSMSVWRISRIISMNNQKFTSNTLSRMNTNLAGQLWWFPAKSKISATDGTIAMADGYKIKTSNITNLSMLSVE